MINDKVVYISSRFVNVLCGILPSIVLVRVLSKSEYGTFAQAQLLVQIFTNIATFGIPKSIYYFCGVGDKKKIIYKSIFNLVLISIFAGAVLYFLKSQFSCAFNNNQLLDLFLLMPFLVLFRAPFMANQAIFVSLGMLSYASKINIVEALLSAITLICLAIYGASVYQLLLGLVFVSMLMFFVMLVPFRKNKFNFAELIDLPFMLKQFNYCLPLAASTATIMLGRRLDQLIIGSKFSVIDFAIYTRGAMELPLNVIITFSLAGMASPLLVKAYNRNDLCECVDVLHDVMKKAALIMFPSFLFFVLVKKEFIVTLFTVQYVESTDILFIYLFLIPLQICAYDVILQCIGNTKIIFYISISSIFLNIVLSYALIPVCGIIAPAIGTVLSYFFMVVIYLKVIKTSFNVTWLRLLPYTYLLKVSIVSALSYCFILLFDLHGFSNILFLLITAIVFFSAYTVLGFFSGLHKFEH